MQSCKVIILDFDGTIVESVDIKDKAFLKLFAEYPLKIQEIMDYHLAHNATIRFDKFKHITENILGMPYDKDMEKRLSKKFSQFVFEQIVSAPYVKGAKEFITFFASKVPLYIISMSPHEEFMNIIRAKQLGKYFKNIYTYPWTKKQALSDIIQKEAISSSEAVFIGDTKEDYETAHAAGVSFIGRYSNRPLDNLPIQVFKNLDEIRNFITVEAD